MRNPDRERWPNVDVVVFPMLLDEVATWSMQDEVDYLEGIWGWWDHPVHLEDGVMCW